MKVTLSDGRIIDVKEPVEKHQIQFLQLAEREKNDDFSYVEVIEWRSNIIMQLTGFKKEDIDNLPIIDKNKLTDAIESRFVVYGKKNYETDF